MQPALGPPDRRGERSFRGIVKHPEQSFAYLNIFKPQNLLFRDSGRANPVHEMRRSETAFVHEVAETDAPKFDGKMKSGDATSATLLRGEATAVSRRMALRFLVSV